jgi:hypothetical protein
MNVVKLERKYGRNSHQRIDIGIDRLMKAEGAGGFGPTVMVEAYRRWLSVAQNGVAPERDLYDGLHFAPNYMIDVSADNPRAFRFNIITPAGTNSGRYSQHVSQIMGSVVSEHPILEMRADMMLEYDACKRSKRASAYRLTHDVNGFVRDYVRLLLPVCDRQGHVTALLGYARHLEVPSG